MKKQLNYTKLLTETLILTGAVLIIAAAVYFFLVPSHTSVSSISGLGIVLSNFVPLPLSAITMILNVVLLIIGFITCGKEFGVKTVYTSIMLPIFLWLYDQQSGAGCALLCSGCQYWAQHSFQPQCFFRWSGYRCQDYEQISTYGSWQSNVAFRHVCCTFCRTCL